MKFIVNNLIFLIVLSSLFSCNADKSESITVDKIPELLERSEKIQNGKEWDIVQNQYAAILKSTNEGTVEPTQKLELAQLYIKEARVTGEHGHYYPAALNQVEEILASKEVPNNIKFLSLVTKASIQLSLHEFADALKTGQEAIVLNPRNAQIFGVLVDANVELGNYDKAIAFADQMVSIKPDIRSYSRVSYLREIHGDTNGAMTAMKMAVEAGFPGTEETAWAMLTLGELHQKYGKLEDAETIYSTVLEMRKDYPFAVAALGDIEFEKGNIEEAEKKYREAIEIIPEVGFYISLAEILKMTKRDEEFKKISSEIDEMLLDDVTHGHNMNLEYANLFLDQREDPNSALKYAEEEYNKRPKNIDVNLMMAKIYTQLDQNDEVKEYAKVALKTNANYPDIQQLQSQLNR